MKHYFLPTLLAIIAVAFSTHAQNYKQLENLTKNLQAQSKELVKRTSKDIRKDDEVSEVRIRRAFLAEQLYASSKLFKKMVSDKYELDDLRAASKALVILSRRIPRTGSNISEWKNAEDSINAINGEVANTKNTDEIRQEPADENDSKGRVFWTGKVDATVHLVLKGSEMVTRTISGSTYPDGIPTFTVPLPSQGDYKIGVKKKVGRGKVKIIQQPNRKNDYTAIVEIFDKGGGAKSYTVEIFW